MNNLKFVDILNTSDELKNKVRRWRNKKTIRQFMLTQHYISKKEHSKWLESLRQKDGKKTWVVFADNVPIGTVYLQNINHSQQNSEWGFYIGEDAYKGKGLGKRILLKLLKIFFDKMKFETILTTLLADNVVALNLYKKFKFTEVDKTTSKNGQKVISLKFSKKDWLKHKDELRNECCFENRK